MKLFLHFFLTLYPELSDLVSESFGCWKKLILQCTWFFYEGVYLYLITSHFLCRPQVLKVMFYHGLPLFFCGYFIQSILSVAYLSVANLVPLGISVYCQVSLGPSIQSGSSPCSELQAVTQSTDQLKDCYPQLIPNSHITDVLFSKQLDYTLYQHYYWY